MNFQIERSFTRDLKKIKDQRIRHAIAETIVEIRGVQHLSQISSLEKLKGSAKGFYRIRIKDFRIGVAVDKSTVVLVWGASQKGYLQVLPERLKHFSQSSFTDMSTSGFPRPCLSRRPSMLKDTV